MRKLKWLIVIVSVMLFLPWQPNVAQSQPSPSGYIAVTLDSIKTEATGPKTNLNLMLAGVAGTDSQLQKLTWPTELWQPVALGEELLGDAREAIPFARAQGWGVRNQAYEAELPVVRGNVVAGKIKLTYSVKRVGPICS